MAIQQDGYFYNQQFKSYILQFMAIFTGLQVSVGKRDEQDVRLIDVPIHYGHPDRVVASVLSQNTQNMPLRLPVMSAYMRSLDMAPELYAGVGTERRKAYVPVGGLVPDDIEVIYQRKPIPYRMDVDLHIYVSNTDQHFQILEQILPLFDPMLQIQTSDSLFDWTKLTHVKLKSIQVESNFPSSTDRRIIQSTLSFEMPVYMDVPGIVRKEFVQRIFARIGTVDTAAVTNFDIVADLDGQGIPYTEVMSGSDLTIDK